MPCLAATQADLNGDATNPCAEAMLTMRPHLLSIMRGRASRVVWNADERLIARIASHLAVGNSAIGATNCIPALLTRMSSRPNSTMVMSIISAIEAGLDISAPEYSTLTLHSAARIAWVAEISSA